MTTENEAVNDEQGDAEFAAAFSDSPPIATAEPEKPVAEPAVAPAEAAAPAAPPTEATPSAPAETPDEIVQLKRSDLARLSAAADKTASLEAQMSKAFGTMGNLQQTIQRLRDQTPAGQSVEITDEDFAELTEAMPEVGKLTRAALEKALKRANVRGTATPAVDPLAVRQEAFKAVIHRERQRLDRAYPSWLEIIGGPQVPTEFRQWLATQPAEYQTELATSDYPSDIQDALNDFTSWKKAQKPAETPAQPVPAAPSVSRPQPAPRAALRQERIQGAIQPRGDGRQPPPGKSAQDFYDEAWQ